MALLFIPGVPGVCAIYGLAADTKPAPTINFTFVETDTGKLYLADGAAWNEVLNVAYQSELVSGVNIKTINGATVLGSGDLVVAGSTNIKQTEIDFGTTPVSEASFTIADADVSATSQLIGSVAYEAPTSKDLDELEMDGLDLKFAPGVGEFTVYVRGMDGYVADKFKLNYLVG